MVGEFTDQLAIAGNPVPHPQSDRIERVRPDRNGHYIGAVAPEVYIIVRRP